MCRIFELIYGCSYFFSWYFSECCNNILDWYKEFLYAALDAQAFVKDRRRVFTWKDLSNISGLDEDNNNQWLGK